MKWRFIDSDLSEPTFTVAADEAMALARSKRLAPNTLHLYRRKHPTVSLGYFQKVSESIDLDFCRANGIHVVRRVTGGSAIYTDSGHLIYGLAMGEEESPNREATMEKVCSAVVLALKELGVASVFKPANDVLVGGRKISGSAQMRRWGIVLQHGTLILRNRTDMMIGALRADIEKVHSRGLEPSNYVISLAEALGHEPAIGEVKSAMLHGFEAALGAEFQQATFSKYEKDTIAEFIESKYGRDDWNLKS
ncbi:MAG: biotin/lipoate A/B protein ligase family protein [Thermoplasmata archaeon]